MKKYFTLFMAVVVCTAIFATPQLPNLTGKKAMQVKKAEVSCCKYFLVLAKLQRGCVNFLFPEAIHRWTWSGCFL